MDFTISEEEKDITALANQILSDNVSPESLHQYDDRETTRFDDKLWAQLAESGLLGIAISEAHGGMGFGFGHLSLLIEECGRVLAPVPVVPTCLSAMAIQQFAGEAESSILGEVVNGKAIISAAIHEDVNEDIYAPTCEVSGGKLTGTKHGVPYFDQAQSLLVVASENGEAGLYLVDPTDATAQGTPLWSTTMEPQCYVTFAGTPATKIGDADAVNWFLERYIISLCSYQVGACDKMLKLTAEYTTERQQFGVPIASFQAVGHRAANCYIDSTCLRLVVQQAVSRLDAGEDAATAVNVAKSWCGDASHRISTTTQHLHGGMGVDRDYSLWRYALWAKQNELQLGSANYHLRQLGDAIAAGDFNIDP